MAFSELLEKNKLESKTPGFEGRCWWQYSIHKNYIGLFAGLFCYFLAHFVEGFAWALHNWLFLLFLAISQNQAK